MAHLQIQHQQRAARAGAARRALRGGALFFIRKVTKDEYRTMMVNGGRSANGFRLTGEDREAQAHRHPQGKGQEALQQAAGGHQGI